MERILSRKLIGQGTPKELVAYLREKLLPLEQPDGTEAWLERTYHIRREMLKTFFRGHPPGLLEQEPEVEWLDVLEPGNGYRIRKLRYEGYPGMWIPALLYEPTELKDKVPAVLNPNGHHLGGKAMDYKQARCINLAKRGMLALNTEFIGMGELRADAEHNRIAHLDLCGIAGVGVFYLAMKRGLDVLLDHPHADPERVAMTGLSGGGWQTAMLSSLDERIKVSIPVAGHSPVWQRMGCESDIGDLEQVPSDLCTVTDFDTLTAMMAPRPTLLIYNRYDTCCFQPVRTRESIYEPIKPIFAMFEAEDKLALHVNEDPGTHNYDSDNRSRLYTFLNKHFGLDTTEQDLPWQDELYTLPELTVGLPADNATLLSLAKKALQQIRHARQNAKPSEPDGARKRLAALLKVPKFSQLSVAHGGLAVENPDCTMHQYVLRLDDTWSIPLNEFIPSSCNDVELVLSDDGRRGSASLVAEGLKSRRRVLAADLFGTGEAEVSWQYHMILASTGERSLGLQIGQLQALIQWARSTYQVDSVHLRANGEVMSVVALAATALDPVPIASLTTACRIDSFGRLIDWPLTYANAAPLFCFGLLKEFDVPDLLSLSAPVPVNDMNQGPLRS